MATYPYQPYQAYQQQMPWQATMYQHPQQQTTQALPARMVSNREEAVAMQIDFNGIPHLAVDWGHKRIFAKVFNSNTGCADLVEFVIAQPKPEPEPVTYATVSDLEMVRNALMDEIKALRNARRRMNKDEEAATDEV